MNVFADPPIRSAHEMDPFERHRTGPALKVLVVEDDESMRAAVREILLMNGLIVNTAADGLAASELASHEDYDVVVTDIRLPKMDGLELSRTLRTKLHPPQVILITAYPEWKVYQEAYAIRVSDILCKPLNLKALAARVISAGSGVDTTTLGCRGN
jgi:DNA-binding response OmpR family regulator